MVTYKVRSLLDITQPLLNHEQTASIPKVFKAIVEVENTKEKDSLNTDRIKIVYIETNGIEIGTGTIITTETKGKVINLDKTQVKKQTQYKVDSNLISVLLSKTMSVET